MVVDVHFFVYALNDERSHASVGCLFGIEVAEGEFGSFRDGLMEEFFVLLHSNGTYEDLGWGIRGVDCADGGFQGFGKWSQDG